MMGLSKYNVKIILLLVIAVLTLASCQDDQEFDVFQEDFFCEDDKSSMFLGFKVEGEDIYFADDTFFNIDLCESQNRILPEFPSKSSIDNELFTRSFSVNITFENYAFTLGFNGTYFKNELDESDDRDYASKVFDNDIQFKVGSVTGVELWTDNEGKFQIPENRPSFAFISLTPPEDIFSVSYKTDDPCALTEFPSYCNDFQEGSFIKISSVEEIDFTNSISESVKYNYIITGTFQCKIYRQNSKDQTLVLESGSFRLPINVPKTSEVF